jgi:hypothetical protein
MTDTTYEIVQDGDAYKVRIARLGNFIQEAAGFASFADASSWIAEDQRIATLDETQKPIDPPHLRVV